MPISTNVSNSSRKHATVLLKPCTAEREQETLERTDDQPVGIPVSLLVLLACTAGALYFGLHGHPVLSGFAASVPVANVAIWIRRKLSILVKL